MELRGGALITGRESGKVLRKRKPSKHKKGRDPRKEGKNGLKGPPNFRGRGPTSGQNDVKNGE